MKLIINNLGFVKKSEIDLNKDLILLCGANNTGKTYVAYTIYGLMKSKSIGLPRIPSLMNKITALCQEKAIEINLAELLDIHQNEILNYIASEYQKQLSSIFSAETSLFEQTRLSLELSTTEPLKSKLLAKTIKQKLIIQNKLHFIIEKPANSFICSCVLVEIENNEKTSISPVLLENILFEQISELFLNWLFPECYIAPTERIAINLFSKELALRRNLLVDELSNMAVRQEQDNQPLDLIKQRTGRYSLPIRDSLKIAEDLVNIKKNHTQFTYLAEEIEKSILHGNISVSQEGEMQFQPQQPHSPKLSIHLTASSVKSLSYLIIYFRHLAKPNDFLILDEPEFNLHPDHQIIMARLLAKIINAGFKVMISTHSDYLIREFNNQIMLSQHKQAQKLMKKYHYTKDELLQPNQVGVYFFDAQSRNSEAIEVTETGFEVSSIDKVINQQNQSSQELYFTLHE
jgi:predicted ATPase